MRIVSKLALEGKITEQHAKEIEETIESYFQERLKNVLSDEREEMSYTKFIKSREVFPKDMYPTRKMTFGKISYKQI